MATKSEIMNKNVVSVCEIVDFNPNEGDDDVTKYNKLCVTLDSTAVSFGYCGLCRKYELKEIPRWSEGANVSLKQHYTACVKANCRHPFFYINEVMMKVIMMSSSVTCMPPTTAIRTG